MAVHNCVLPASHGGACIPQARAEKMRDLPTQSDVMAWVRARWPERCGIEPRAMKLGEEAGEVLGAVIKTLDGDGRKSLADVELETAQVVICAMGVAEAAGFDLFEAVAAEWKRCN